MPDHNFI